MIEQGLISLAILFSFVVVGGIIARKIKQPIGIGLLLVGALIGPYALNLVKDSNFVSMAIEFGSILLLFVIGLEFVIPKLARVGFKALMIGILKIGIVFFLSFEAMVLFGYSAQIAIIFGMLLSLSSTVVIFKILEAKGLYTREEMPLLIGVLLIEDLVSVVMLTFLTKISAGGALLPIIEDIVLSISILTLAYVVMLKSAKFIVTWFVDNSSEEVFAFIALAGCTGFSLLAYFLGLSPAIGAFLAGSIVASLPHAKMFEKAIRPYTDMFTSLFFISIGTTVNLFSLKESYNLILILAGLIILTRFIAVGVISHLFASFKREQVFFSSIAMIALSEFSLLLAQSAMKFNLGVDFVSIVSVLIFLTAVLMSLTISHTKMVSSIIDTAPVEWRSAPRSISKYLKQLFEEIDIESQHTSIFKKQFFTVLSLLLGVLFLMIGAAKLHTPVLWKLLLMYAAISSLIGVALYTVYKRGKILHFTLVEILSNTDHTGSRKNSRYILNTIGIALLLFIFAVYSPIVLVGLSLPFWTNYLVYALLAYVFLKLKQVTQVIHTLHKATAF